MLRIDSHQHFWQFNEKKQKWIDEEMAVLRSDFLPQQLLPLLHKTGIEGCIAVQADESEAENIFLLKLAEKNNFIKGLIGWLDFLDPGLEDKMNFYSQFKLVKGFRYVLQDKAQRDMMLGDVFKSNVQKLAKYNFTYDLLIFRDQLAHATELVNLFPDQIFILDHMAKPQIETGEIETWRKDIQAFSKHENVYCKVSGMVTEANWKDWKQEDFAPYLDTVFNAFGPERLLFGSDWPVCNLAGGYEKALEVVKGYTSSLTAIEQAGFWGGNAKKCYHLS